MKKKYLCIILVLLSLPVFSSENHDFEEENNYVPIGIGGGGALSGVAISPYDNLWFVGTDMGTLFRSVDQGKKWNAVNHFQATFGTDLTRASSPGFSSDAKTIFHAVDGINPKRSTDKGITFQPMTMELKKDEFIRYWQGDSKNPDLIFCGTNKGLLRSDNKGNTWTRLSGMTTESAGTFFDEKIIYHASRFSIWTSTDGGKKFKKAYTPGLAIRSFTGGRDAGGLTLAFIDDNGKYACSWVNAFRKDWERARINDTLNNCGYVWISNKNSPFKRTSQIGGDHIRMAENDSSTIYVTGGRKWIRQYGTKVHVSRDSGATWKLKLHQLNWDVNPFEPWPKEKLEYSAPALDIGWWDDGYESFEVNKRDSSTVAGTGYFFIHASQNFGETWRAPFTENADTNIPMAPGKKWKTRGVEVISVYKTKFHPRNPQLLYAASADIGGMVSQNGGQSFRVTRAGYNSIYDFAFDPSNENIVYAVSGNLHDYPNEWRANPITNNGGVYLSDNKGQTWTRLTPENTEMNRQFLSVGYDPLNKRIYAGSQETGIILSTDSGKTWKYFNEGFPAGDKIISQIEIDPSTGNVYALLTGNRPHFTNQPFTGIYFLDVKNGSSKWQLLRKNLVLPTGNSNTKSLWLYPTKFAVDFKSNVLWLVDYENHSNWLVTGIWKSTDRGDNWHRMEQMTHPTDIIIDSRNPDHIHVSGYFVLNGNWGNGGQMYSTDGGKTWNKNLTPPLQQNARSVTLDPVNPRKLIYSYFGGGMLSGPNPAY